MTRQTRKWAVPTLLTLLLGLAGAAPSWAQKGIQPVYEKNCATCHGSDGAGNTAAAKRMKIPDLRSKEVQHLSDKELFNTIAYGNGHKQYPHAWADKGMSGVLIRDLVDYLRELAKPTKK